MSTSDPSPLPVREHLVQALEADLIGPYAGHDAKDASELLKLPPSRYYLTGFLAPQGEGQINDDPTDEDEVAAGSDEDMEDSTGPEPEPKQRRRFPASLGLSVLVPEPSPGEQVLVTLSWADYVAEELEPDPDAPKKRGPRPIRWRRVPREDVRVEVPLDQAALAKGVTVPNTGGVTLIGNLKRAEGRARYLPEGTRALALFVVNRRPLPADRRRADECSMFQVRLRLEVQRPLIPRPNRRGEESDDWDERVADLQFRDHVEYAVGHGVSVHLPSPDDPVHCVETTWLPRGTVHRVTTRPEPGVITDMGELASLPNAAALRQGVEPLIAAYGEWIKEQGQVEVDSQPRAEARDELARRAERARARIAAALDVLEADPEAFEAFKLMNRAMADAALARSPDRYTDGKRPAWRLFQLAFVLLNVRGLAAGGLPGASPEAAFDRETVELIFFPTGGGKTEAYLGVIAFTLVLRRVRGRTRPDGGLGVAVLLRYTLRLLTLDQLARAATLICALERLRLQDPERLGEVRFSVGLWVGRAATPNTLRDAARQITEYKNSSSKNANSPFPLTDCPWCGAKLNSGCLSVRPNQTRPEEVVVGCSQFRCEFATGKNPAGLPVVFVDEQVYRELPAFVVATVDKFAMLPWRGETGLLFGRASSREGQRFFGPLDGRKQGSHALPEGLRPPELIVQDELHLISGPLGTLVGLYETAIGELCKSATPPKVIAATATVRRAQAQIRALFGRSQVAMFPSQGVDESETFFAEKVTDEPGRLYVGLAAPGRSMKALLLRAYVGLLAAGELRYPRSGEEDGLADAYMTLAGYFNSLRVLGGMRRLVEDEVRARVSMASRRRPEDAEAPHRWFADRTIALEPVELTSRESTGKIAAAKRRLEQTFRSKDAVDVLLASNMISVGVDIDRLGLMVVAGQPKTTSEYIQATSRVGRDKDRPGLVVTCLNVMKPRDRSHYERFSAYHSGFYRFVEATSVTPFSGPALSRGLAGTLLAIARLNDPTLTPPTAVMSIEEQRDLAEAAATAIAARGEEHKDLLAGEAEELRANLTQRCRSLIDAWVRLTREALEAGGPRCYSPYDQESKGKPLLYTVTDEEQPPPNSPDARFAAPTSMRDVEASVHLWLETTRNLGGGRG